MNQTRFNAAMASVQAVARKVYEAVPCVEEWSFHQVAGELQRLGSTSIRDRRTIEGCLGALGHAGLIRISGPQTDRRYVRVKVTTPLRVPSKATVDSQTQHSDPRQEGLPDQTLEPTVPTTTATPSAVQLKPLTAPLDRLCDIAESLTKLAETLRVTTLSVAELAKAVEDSALDAAEEAHASTEQLKKFEALKTALDALRH